MVHAGEGTLQAYLDGEVDSATAVALADHVAGCALCSSELDALRRADLRLTEALGLIDDSVVVPVLRARAALAQQRQGGGLVRRYGARSLAKAAGLVLLLAGAGAAAIPEVRHAIESAVVTIAERLTGQADTPAEPDADTVAVPAPGLSFITPSAGRVRVFLLDPAGRIDVVVRLVEAERARVETSLEDGPARLRSGAGRLELLEPGAGTVVIEIPRSVRNASVEVNGRVRVHKAGDELTVSGPGVDDRGSEVRFTIDP